MAASSALAAASLRFFRTCKVIPSCTIHGTLRRFSSYGQNQSRRTPLRRVNRPQVSRFQPTAAAAANNTNEYDRPNSVMLFPADYTDLEYVEEFEYGEDPEEDEEEATFEEDPYYTALTNVMRQKEKIAKERKERWIKNAEPPVRVPLIDARGRSYGRGGRKTARARVWIQPGFGAITVNQKAFEDYFIHMSDRDHILEPMIATKTLGEFDVTVIVQGGGKTGQAGATRHGLARALNNFNPDLYRPPLKYLGFLTRDDRVVERKKIGRKKARKSPQWVKR
jgi:small subunit ribosomal protein S9